MPQNFLYGDQSDHVQAGILTLTAFGRNKRRIIAGIALGTRQLKFTVGSLILERVAQSGGVGSSGFVA